MFAPAPLKPAGTTPAPLALAPTTAAPPAPAEPPADTAAPAPEPPVAPTPAAPPAPAPPVAPAPGAPPGPSAPVPPVRAPPGPVAPAPPAEAKPPVPAPASPPALEPPAAAEPPAPAARIQRRANHSRSSCGEGSSRPDNAPEGPPSPVPQTPSVWSYMNDGYTGLSCDGDGDGDGGTFEAVQRDPELLKQQTPSAWTYMNNGYTGLSCDGAPEADEAVAGDPERGTRGGCGSMHKEWSAEFGEHRGKRGGNGRGVGEGGGGEVKCGYVVDHKGSVFGFLNGDSSGHESDSSGQYRCVKGSGEELARASCDNWASF
ncbi:unnamed protein product [Closterium sp. NIES-54]